MAPAVLSRPRMRSEGTKPERAVRAALLRLGQRFDCNVQGIPGTPDIVLPGKRAVFVNGCMWHGHNCARGKIHGAHRDFWRQKQVENIRHDIATEASLLARGWEILTLWECETRDFGRVQERLREFLENKLGILQCV